MIELYREAGNAASFSKSFKAVIFCCFHCKGDQSWVFNGRTDVEAETPILWPPHVKNWLLWKDPDAGKDWRQEAKGMTEDEMAGWHHWLDGVSVSELWELVMDREAWRAVIHGIVKSQTWLSELNWTEGEFLMKKKKILETLCCSDCPITLIGTENCFYRLVWS